MKFFISLLIMVFSLNSAFAGKVETPTSLTGAKIVTAAEAKAAQAAGGIIVDTRKRLEYAEKHIKGAISVSYKEKSAKTVDFDASSDKWRYSKKLTDKNATIILHCNGITCWKSYKAAKMAVKEGFKNVLWFRTGMPAWNKAGFETE